MKTLTIYEGGWKLIAVSCFAVGVLCGCITSTVVPDKVVPTKPAVSQTGKADGGVISFEHNPDKSIKSALIVPDLRERYNMLIAKYGNRFMPALTPDAGIEKVGDVYRIDAYHFGKIATMNRWLAEGK